jgi:hypothetical protein
MSMKRDGLLRRIDQIRTGAWIDSFRSDLQNTYDDAWLEATDPGYKHIRRMTDDELAELMSREPGSKQGLIAASVLRGRESWKTPAKWALVVSILSFGLACAALARSFD